ncbi:MAG: hypothetical protein QOE48_2500, partial [Mycobacterium sp.]|nr:hypothetical protein [Mycobacterium sp.]
PFLSRRRDKKGYADIGVMPTGSRYCLVGAASGLDSSA